VTGTPDTPVSALRMVAMLIFLPRYLSINPPSPEG
jgi:hypothetical protein